MYNYYHGDSEAPQSQDVLATGNDKWTYRKLQCLSIDFLRIIHFCGNTHIPSNQEDYNECFKIQPLVDSLRKRFQSCVHRETYLSIDKPMAPFNWASMLR